MGDDEILPLSLDEMGKVFEKAIASPHFECAVDEINSYLSLRGCKGRDETLEALRILLVATSMSISAVRTAEAPPVVH